MILTDKAKKDFNHWRFEIKKYSRAHYVSEYNNIVVIALIEQWMNSLNAYLIPSPVLGPKNGYDSFPILGWRYDIIMTNKGNENSFYMGYPIQDWFVQESLESGETFSDINIKISENLDEAKKSAIRKFNDFYNKQ